MAGTRANGNGFDLNRDFLTQSQSEVEGLGRARCRSGSPLEVLDLHGYVTPTLIEATTKPHNPSIEYDLWLKWNQARIDANEAAWPRSGSNVTRPINDWCAGRLTCPPARSAALRGRAVLPCPARRSPRAGTTGARSTPRCTHSTSASTAPRSRCATRRTALRPARLDRRTTRGRLGAFQAQYDVTLSTLDFVVDNRNDMLYDEAERYRRGVAGEPRVACCPAAVRRRQQLDEGVPRRVRDPGRQRPARPTPRPSASSTGCSSTGSRSTRSLRRLRFGGQTYDKGSYVVWMNQAHRGLADTALNIGVDVSAGSASSTRLRRPGATATCGAPTSSRSRSTRGFSPETTPISKTTTPRRRRRVRPRRGLRPRARLGDGGPDAQRARSAAA